MKRRKNSRSASGPCSELHSRPTLEKRKGYICLALLRRVYHELARRRSEVSDAVCRCNSPARAVSGQVHARRVLTRYDADSAGCAGGPALRVYTDGLAQLVSLA